MTLPLPERPVATPLPIRRRLQPCRNARYSCLRYLRRHLSRSRCWRTGLPSGFVAALVAVASPPLPPSPPIAAELLLTPPDPPSPPSEFASLPPSREEMVVAAVAVAAPPSPPLPPHRTCLPSSARAAISADRIRARFAEPEITVVAAAVAVAAPPLPPMPPLAAAVWTVAALAAISAGRIGVRSRRARDNGWRGRRSCRSAIAPVRAEPDAVCDGHLDRRLPPEELASASAEPEITVVAAVAVAAPPSPPFPLPRRRPVGRHFRRKKWPPLRPSRSLWPSPLSRWPPRHCRHCRQRRHSHRCCHCPLGRHFHRKNWRPPPPIRR